MHYISIDIETTGLDWNKNTLIEFGAIIEDTSLQLPFDKIPKFSAIVEHDDYNGDPYALALHQSIFKELSLPVEKRTEKVIPFNRLAYSFFWWLCSHEFYHSQMIGDGLLHGYPYSPIKINVAGKNFAKFDDRFIEFIPDFNRYFKINHRVIDPAGFYYDDTVDTDGLPDLSKCKQRAQMPVTTVAHRTLRDAMDVVELLRGKMYPKI